MVRLKVNNNLFISDLSGISIPYGAIKRNEWLDIQKSYFKFQFLMVRLKERWANHLVII